MVYPLATGEAADGAWEGKKGEKRDKKKKQNQGLDKKCYVESDVGRAERRSSGRAGDRTHRSAENFPNMDIKFPTC